ncbi:MAG: hypothetical protein ACRCYP_01655 [Alphaproteobacteria bacterium]
MSNKIIREVYEKRSHEPCAKLREMTVVTEEHDDKGLPWTTDRIHVHNLGQLKQIVDAAIAEHGIDTPVGYSSVGNQDYQDGLTLEQIRVSELSIQFLHGDRVVQSPVNPVTDIPVFIIG